MGICEILTIIFVVCKLLGVIAWSWFYVLLPEIIAFVFYAIIVIVTIVLEISTARAVKKFRKRYAKHFLNDTEKET